MAVLIGFPPLEFFEPMQFSDGRVTVRQLPLLLQESLSPLDETGQGDLFLVGEQVHPANVLQVQAQQIRGAAATAFPGIPCRSGFARQVLRTME